MGLYFIYFPPHNPLARGSMNQALSGGERNIVDLFHGYDRIFFFFLGGLRSQAHLYRRAAIVQPPLALMGKSMVWRVGSAT